MEQFQAQRRIPEYRHRLEAPPEKVFPLLCPVREYDWIEFWKCEMVYTESGVAEMNCIFTTDFPGEGPAVWTVSRYEPNRRIEFVVVHPGSHTTHLAIVLQEVDGGATEIHRKHTFTGLNTKGNAQVEHLAGEKLPALMPYLDRAIEHYLRTGEMLRGAEPLT